mgnify:CR=1 FL=1
MYCVVKRIVPILLALAMCGCSNNTQNNNSVNNSVSSESSSSLNNVESANSGSESNNSVSSSSASTRESSPTSESGDIIEQEQVLSPKVFPQELEEIPHEYFNAAQEQGTLVDLNYTTYESFSYEEKTQELQKRAVVYLPYGYNEQEKYNVFYLMHGGWSNETTTLGTSEAPSAMKNVLDNAISEGRISPLIVVCPTYNNTSSEDSASYSLALQLTRNYHNELINDLIPAVEGEIQLLCGKYVRRGSDRRARSPRIRQFFNGFCHDMEDIRVLSGLLPIFRTVKRKSYNRWQLYGQYSEEFGVCLERFLPCHYDGNRGLCSLGI